MEKRRHAEYAKYQVNFRCGLQLWDDIKAEASKRETSMASFIRRTMREELERSRVSDVAKARN